MFWDSRAWLEGLGIEFGVKLVDGLELRVQLDSPQAASP